MEGDKSDYNSDRTDKSKFTEYKSDNSIFEPTDTSTTNKEMKQQRGQRGIRGIRGEKGERGDDTYLTEDIFDLKLKVIEQKLDDFGLGNSEDHAKLIGQMTTINGSVVKIKEWQNRLIGSIAVLTTLIVPVAIWLIIKMLENFIK